MTHTNEPGPDGRAKLQNAHIASLLDQMQLAASRVAALRVRASEELLEDIVVLEAFQELDSAHEELRVAEEHLHTQADAIELAQESLDAERRRYVDLFNSAPESYLVTDLSGTVLEANRRAAELFNIDGAYLPGKPLMTFLVGDDRQRLSHLLQRLAARDSVERGVLHLHPRKTDVSLRILVSACRAAARIDRPNEPRALRWLLREALPDQQSTEREADLELRLEMRRRELDDTRYLLDRGIVREQAAQQRAEQAEQRLAELQAALAALATAAEGGETSVTVRVREQQLEVLRSNQVIARVPR